MIDGHIEMLVIELEGEIQKVHVITMCLISKGIRVGVLVLEEGNHIEIGRIPRNLGIIGVLPTVPNHQDFTKEVGLPPQMMQTKG